MRNKFSTSTQLVDGESHEVGNFREATHLEEDWQPCRMLCLNLGNVSERARRQQIMYCYLVKPDHGNS